MKQVAIGLLLVMLAGCAALTQKLGLEQADTTRQKLAYAYILLAEVRNNAAHLVEVKRLDVDTARHVQGYADIAQEVLDQSKAAHFQDDQNKAVRLLQSAESMLGQIQKIVADKQARP